MDAQVVLITGASRGFGAAAARLIAGRGHTVVATMRDPARDAAAVTAGLRGPDPPGPARRHRARRGRGRRRRRAVDARPDRRADQQRRLRAVRAGRARHRGAALAPARHEHVRGVADDHGGAPGHAPSGQGQDRQRLVAVGAHRGADAGALRGHQVRPRGARRGPAVRGRRARREVCSVEPGMYASDWQTSNLDVVDGVAGGPYEALVAERLDGFQAPRRHPSRFGQRRRRARRHRRPRPTAADALAGRLRGDAGRRDPGQPLGRGVGLAAAQRRPRLRGAGRCTRSRRRRPSTTGRPGTSCWSPAPRGGFGAEAARELARRGNTVVATMRVPERDAPAVVAGFEDLIHPVRLDVTDPGRGARRRRRRRSIATGASTRW